MSLVSYVKAPSERAHSLRQTILNSLDLIDCQFAKDIRNVVIKPNMCYYWDYSTGQTTNPKFVATLIHIIRDQISPNANISIVESDASAMKCKYAFKFLGYEKMAKNHNVRLVNLSEDKNEKVEVTANNQRFHFMLPRTIKKADLRINNTYKWPVVIVRCFNTYGPRQSDTGYAAVIPKFIKRALQALPPIICGDGKQTRDYMYVKDCVKAYELLINSHENLLGKAINFRTGRETSVLDLANVTIKLFQQEGNMEPVHVAPRPGEVKRLCADITLAKEQLGFEPNYNIEEGLKELIKV